MNKKYYFMGEDLTFWKYPPFFYLKSESKILLRIHQVLCLSAMFSAHDSFMGNELYHGYPKPYQVNEIVGSIIGHWYSDVDKPVIIDKNRAWTI